MKPMRVVTMRSFKYGLRRLALMTACAVGLMNAPAHAQTYTVTDLWVQSGAQVRAFFLNASGQVAGEVLTLPRPYAFLFSGGVLVDLGALDGRPSTATALNDAGQVTGAVRNSDGMQHAFLYSNGVMTDLGVLPGGTWSVGYAINSAGEVAGMGDNAFGATAFKYSNGVMTDLGTFGGGYATPFAINDAGQVAGYSYAPGGTIRAFLHSDGVMTDIGTLGGSSASAYAINNDGQVTGESYMPGGAATHAFLYRNGVMTDLGTLGGTYSIGLQINTAGQVIGHSLLAGDVDSHAFVYSGGIMKDLGTLGGSQSFPFAINSSGQVVGSSYIATDVATHGFLYSGGTMLDLNTVIPAGWEIIDAIAINDSGQILGSCRFNGLPRGCLLTPMTTTTAHVEPPIAADGSSVFNARRGVIPVRFTIAVNGAPTCQLPEATIVVTRTAGGVIGAIDESVYDAAADMGSNFRISDCQYMYNLAASALGTGHYRVDILIAGQAVGHAEFSLR